MRVNCILFHRWHWFLTSRPRIPFSCFVVLRSGVGMSAIVLIILTVAPNAHTWIHTHIMKGTVNTSIVSVSTGCLAGKYVMTLISFFYTCRHFAKLNLSTWLSVVKNSKIRYRPPWTSQQMEVTGTEIEYSRVAPYTLHGSVGQCLLQLTSVLHLELLTSRS